MEKVKSDKLTLKHKIGYSLGDAGGCMTFALMGTIFSVYCTDILLINPITLAAIVAIWNIWDFINDPIMGALMDKSFVSSKNKKGKFRPWLLRATPLLCVTFIGLFTVPTFFDGIASLCFLFGLKILYEASYTMFNIPMGSLLSAMSKNDEERASLSSFRGIGSGIGNMIPIMVAPKLIKLYGETNAKGYAVAAIICALIGFVMCLLHYKLTEERNVSEVNSNNHEEAKDNVKFSDILKVFKVNKPFVALCVHGLFICMMQYVTNNLSGYMYSVVLGDIGLVSDGTIISAPFMMLIFIFGAKLAKKFELVKLIRYSLLIGSALYILLFGLHMITYVQPIIHMIISGVAMGIASVSIYLQWGLVGDAIEHNQKLTGKRTEGSIYGTFNLSRRVGQTIGHSGSLLLLAAIGYNATLEVQSNLTITGLKVLCVLLPGIIILGSWAAFKFIWKTNSKEKDNATITETQIEE